MSGTDSKLPSQQLNLDAKSTQSPEAVLAPSRKKERRNTVPVQLDDRIHAMWDRETASRERSELRHKLNLD